MKINYMSDLHTERGIPDFNISGDILILAGDIIPKADCRYINKLAEKFNDVIYVMGNHDFYATDYDHTINKIINDVANNVHVLDDRHVIIRGQRFVGTTLWTDLSGPDGYIVASSLNDFRFISYKNRRFSIEDATHLFNISKGILEDTINDNDIVITHHLPTFSAISEKYSDSLINSGFASNLDSLILSKKPKYWIFGHTHDSKDFMLGDTRLLCNPYGYYPNDLNPEFNVNASFEV